MIKRREPDLIFEDIPCSIVAVGTAIGKMPPRPATLKDDGYMTLADMNGFCRSLLKVEKMVQFRRGSRPTLKAFLELNKRRAIVCVLGHYLYAERNTYWSFHRNGKDEVVAVWYLKKEEEYVSKQRNH